MSPKISSKTYHFLPKFQNLPHQLRIFLYILYIFNSPEQSSRRAIVLPRRRC